MTTDALRIRDLTVGYGRRRVIDSLSVEALEPGHVTALVGPNGAGKSTLLRAIAGLVRAGGSVRLGDRELVGLGAPALAALVTFVPQALPQGVALSVLEGVLSAFRASRVGDEVPSHDDAVARAHAVLERLGIEHLALRRLDELSGGERQLAGLAQAVVRDPRVLLLDEPTSALDLRHQLTVMTLARDLADEGRIVVAALHDLPSACRWSDRVLVMRAGRVEAFGAPDDAIDAGLLARVYGVDARVERCSQGQVQIIVDGVARAPR
jgi:iron complex transport system ATP-binding protein